MSALTEALLLRLVDAGLQAAAAGVAREAILDKVREKLAAGATPEQIPAAIVAMRDEALDKAEAQAKAKIGAP